MADSQQPPGARTASTCSAATARGTHAFKIADYSLHKNSLGSRKFVRSAAFAVGGYDWCVRYYPDGDGVGDLAVYLELLTKNAKVRALFQFTLIDHVNASQSSVISLDQPCVFNSAEAGQNVMGAGLKIPGDLENSPSFLRDNCHVLECDVTVLNEPQVVPVGPKIQVPPSTLRSNLAQLLAESGEDADVTYEVKGEVFPAHKIILAMQSPVFKAELYGPMRVDTSTQNITVEDMEPDVFKVLLHYIYTDALPSSMSDLEGGDREEMVKHLLVAADRYGIERMKLMCENILCESLDVGRVAATLALADQHHCSRLKDACIEFMNSPGRMDDVVATQGYKDLKTSCPAMLVDVLERANKSRKI